MREGEGWYPVASHLLFISPKLTQDVGGPSPAPPNTGTLPGPPPPGAIRPGQPPAPPPPQLPSYNYTLGP